jgi:hypothetical protein
VTGIGTWTGAQDREGTGQGQGWDRDRETDWDRDSDSDGDGDGYKARGRDGRRDGNRDKTLVRVMEDWPQSRYCGNLQQ